MKNEAGEGEVFDRLPVLEEVSAQEIVIIRMRRSGFYIDFSTEALNRLIEDKELAQNF